MTDEREIFLGGYPGPYIEGVFASFEYHAPDLGGAELLTLRIGSVHHSRAVVVAMFGDEAVAEIERAEDDRVADAEASAADEYAASFRDEADDYEPHSIAAE